VTRASQGGGVKVVQTRPALRNVLIAAAIVALVLLGAFAVMQQEQIGTLSRQLSQQDSGTVMLNGTRFAYVQVPVASLNYPAVVKFEGVTFNITSGTTGNLVFITSPASVSQVSGSNGTISFVVKANNATQYSQGTPITVRAFLSPSIIVTFSDGTRESYVQNVVATSNPGPSSSLWFSHHTNPQAGILWDSNTNSYVLYVSLG
jgi:hypothetical protein